MATWLPTWKVLQQCLYSVFWCVGKKVVIKLFYNMAVLFQVISTLCPYKSDIMKLGLGLITLECFTSHKVHLDQYRSVSMKLGVWFTHVSAHYTVITLRFSHVLFNENLWKLICFGRFCG